MFHDLASNGINKPVLNTFRMLGQMSGDRVSAVSSAGLPVEEIPPTKACAARQTSRDLRSWRARLATVLLWNYHDDASA